MTKWTSSMDKQDLDGVWTVLSSSVPASGISVAPTGDEVSAGQLLAGIDSEGRRHFLIPLFTGEPAKTDTKGRAVHLGRIALEGSSYLTVVCLRPELHRVFTQFCRELAESVEDAKSPAREAGEAFDRGRALFSDAVDRGLLGEEALLGLLGELLTVRDLLLCGAPGTLEFWTGPSGEIHDLRTATHAIEVKSTLLREGRIVAIASVDQLQEPLGADLILHHTRFERDPGGSDLRKVVADVLTAGADHAAVSRRLLEVGVDIDDLPLYSGRKYRVVETRAYDVTGAAFPRLLRSSYIDGNIPPGTLRISYAIDLTNEPPTPLDAHALEAALDAMAREATDALDS
jgi:hypothetical protein